jgi:hypothetical protein
MIKVYKQAPENRKRIAELAAKLPALPLFHNGKIVTLRKTVLMSWDELTFEQQVPIREQYKKEIEGLIKVGNEIMYPKNFVQLHDRKFYINVGQMQKINHSIELNKAFRSGGNKAIEYYAQMVVDIHKQLMDKHQLNKPIEKTLLQKIKTYFK